MFMWTRPPAPPLFASRENTEPSTQRLAVLHFFNNNNEYLERLTRTNRKRLHILYEHIFSKFNAYNMHARTHTHTHTHPPKNSFHFPGKKTTDKNYTTLTLFFHVSNVSDVTPILNYVNNIKHQRKTEPITGRTANLIR